MRSFLNPLFALMLAAALAACSSTPTEDDSSATDDMSQQTDTSPVTPVEPSTPSKPDTSSIPLTADNFYNHPSNYDGTTDSRVIYFAFDSNTVPAAAFETLRAHATYLKNNSNAKVRLEGHADERGTREYNLALGERRAVAVRDYLVALGVPGRRLGTISYGKERPQVVGQGETYWSQNRRGVLVVQ